ncbi:MAG: DUF1549 domain-containing protein [Luteolibacter sp.]
MRSFIRRAFIDIVGELPSVPGARGIPRQNDAKKREALVDQLLSRKEFTEMWVMKWAELLQIRTFQKGGSQVSYKAALSYYNWLRERIAGEHAVQRDRPTTPVRGGWDLHQSRDELTSSSKRSLKPPRMSRKFSWAPASSARSATTILSIAGRWMITTASPRSSRR